MYRHICKVLKKTRVSRRRCRTYNLIPFCLDIINKLYVSAVNQPGGTKQGRGELTGKFAAKPLADLSWRGLIRRIFQQLHYVKCSCGQKEFPSPDALIRHIERSHPNDKDSVRFCVRTTSDQSSSHSSIVTHLKEKYGKGTSSKEFCPKCGEKFECLTQGVFESGSAIMVYSNDMVVCDNCDKYT